MHLRTQLAALAAAPLLALPMAACGSSGPPHCDPHVTATGAFGHGAFVGFNCHGATVDIVGFLNTTPGTGIEGQRWHGVAGGNGAAFYLQHYCRWDFSRTHYEFVSAAAYWGKTLVGSYQGPYLNVGACG